MPLQCGLSAPSQGSFGPRHVNDLGLFSPLVKKAALPSHSPCPTEAVTLLSLPCVKLPTESAIPDPENSGNVGPSQSVCGHMGTVREPLTGHLE